MQPSVYVPRETSRETLPPGFSSLKGLAIADQSLQGRVPYYPVAPGEDQLSRKAQLAFWAERTLRASARVHGVSEASALSPIGSRAEQRARMTAMFLLLVWFGLSHQRIADLMNAKRNSVTRNIETIRAELLGTGRVLPLTLAAIVEEMRRETSTLEVA